VIAISMLGPMTVSLEGRRQALDLGPGGRLLASYLFQFPGRVFRREQLAEMFWTDRSLAQARAAMNTALWRLRSLLSRTPAAEGSRPLAGSGDELVFERPDWIAIDTHDFDAAVRGALAEPAAAPLHIERLEQAAQRYGGRFLDGDDAEWVTAERERLHSLYMRCLGRLITCWAAVEDYEPAIDAARRVLAADPFRETMMRTLAILLFLNGQRAQAIGDLTRWQMALRAQVGVDPLPETRALRASLISGLICDEIGRWRQQHLGARPGATQAAA